MAPDSTPSSHLHLNKKLDLDSIVVLVSLANRHFHQFLSDPDARKSLQLKCNAKLTISNHGYFEFSEHSVLSNLYWGIESFEVAIQSESPEEKAFRLANSERMFQIPALLEEDGSTARIANRYLVCCSYFYLSLVRKLRGDEWQMIMHFLQSLLVSSCCVRTELAPALWESLFGSLATGRSEEEVDEAARQQARRYKDWLMYYQVVSYGETPPWLLGCSDAGTCNGQSPDHLCRKSVGTRYSDSIEQANTFPIVQDAKMINPLDIQESTNREKNTKAWGTAAFLSAKEDHMTSMAFVKLIQAKRINPLDIQENTNREKNTKAWGTAASSEEQETFPEIVLLTKLGESFDPDSKESLDIRCLQDMLEETQSDTSVSFYSQVGSTEASDSEAKMHNGSPEKIISANTDYLASKTGERDYLAQCSPPEPRETCASEATKYRVHAEDYEVNAGSLFPSRSHSSLDDFNFSILGFGDVESHPFCKCYFENGTPPRRSPTRDFRCFSNFSSKFLKYSLPELVPRGSFARKELNISKIEKDWSAESSNYENDTQVELLGRFEKAVSNLCFSEGPGKGEDAGLEVTTVWEMLKSNTEVKYTSIKKEILDQLLDIISTSKKEKVISASVSILLVLVSEDRTVTEDIKRKDLHLNALASALKRNVHEAAVLIYLLNPKPSEIKELELLPALVEVACNSNSYKAGSISLPLTPTAASIAMIEILVTAFDYVTNNMHLATISSPQVLSKLVNVAMNKNLEEGVALAAVLVRCMRLNGNCRKFLSQVTPVDPFLHLLRSNDRRAKNAALEYFHEILHMPRSSAIRLLHQIREQGGINIMHTLTACIQQADLEHRLLAANFLLQLDMLEESHGKSIFKEEAMEVLLESIASEESSTHTLSAFILSNLGGTYAWTGEPYTAAWLVKKAGLTSAHQKNMIRNVDWLDPCLQDAETDAWSGKIARGVIKIGKPIFNALAKGIQSEIRSISRDCLITIAWLGCEMAVVGPSNLRYSACEILLSGIAQFLHPGSELDERVIACLCIYNYTSGKGKQKLMNFSEGLRESLRRLSGITWMAGELLKVTDYLLPTKLRVSCVHAQILEAGKIGSGATTALIFYKGQLYAGYSDGSMKVWDIKGQTTKLVCEIKEHKKPVTCFTLYEPGGSLLSGSSDKTVRVWQMVQKKLECVEVIEMKEPIHKVESYGDRIFVITQSRGLKVCHASRSIHTVCKNKHVKSLAVAQGKIYLGCTDSSMQEVDIMDDQKTEIKAPGNTWRMQNKPINSVVLYKDWVYCAGAIVEGSSVKEWRRRSRPLISIAMTRGTNVQEMAVVEDFIYLNCSSSPSTLEIWLREKQQKVGRLSAGSKIMSLLTANDIVLCGTETGLIKGWIPL